MYCSGCGTEILAGLNYCSRCGKRVSDDIKPPSSPIARSLTVAGNTAGVGFAGFIFVLLVLVLNGVVGSNVVGVTFFYFLGLFLICYMFMRQGRLAAKLEPPKVPVVEQAYLKPVTTAQLTEPSDRPASVTEHTTRTLDHVNLERS
jgi:hypothetical protein